MTYLFFGDENAVLSLRVCRLTALFSSFCSMKWLGVFLLPPGWDASPSQGYPRIRFAGTQYTWVERDTTHFPGQGSHPDRSFKLETSTLAMRSPRCLYNSRNNLLGSNWWIMILPVCSYKITWILMFKGNQWNLAQIWSIFSFDTPDPSDLGFGSLSWSRSSRGMHPRPEKEVIRIRYFSKFIIVLTWA